MHKSNQTLWLSATDLVNNLSCVRSTQLDLKVANKELAKPARFDPFLEVLRDRGMAHEASYTDQLKGLGLSVFEIEDGPISEQTIVQTMEAMKAGHDVITQAALRKDQWQGKADFLRKVATPSNLGAWSYEVIDTKLAQTTKGGTILQLCLYAELVAEVQGPEPERVYVVTPAEDLEPEEYRVADYAAFYRKAKRAAEGIIARSDQKAVYPEPVPHCDVCRWEETCDRKRREDDHLCLVAGLSRNQREELNEHGVKSVSEFATLPLPLSWIPKRGSAKSLESAREQARIQVESRNAGSLKYEMLPIEDGFGLCRLPEPSPGDIFFDIEGDAHVGDGGLEYLFGYACFEENDQAVYQADWALDREQEKAIFERFIDFVVEMHIPEHSAGDSDNIRPPVPGYSATSLSLVRDARFSLVFFA